jgi:hypothetical protein
MNIPTDRFPCRLTPQLSGRASMAPRGVTAPTYPGPLQLLVMRHLRSVHPIHFRPERIIRSALGTLADEDLKARLFVERLSGMITVTSRDTQAVALDQCLKLSRKVHLEIQ